MPDIVILFSIFIISIGTMFEGAAYALGCCFCRSPVASSGKVA